MSDGALERPSRPVQATALSHIMRRMQRADQAPWLHGEVARRMSERLALIRLQPGALIDWWSFNGGGEALLRQAYPKASLLRVEDQAGIRHGASSAALPWWSPRRWAAARSDAVVAHEIPAGSAGLLWANMMLHLVADPDLLLQHWHRALQVDGFVMFSTLGPGSLSGLRDIYARRGWPAPHAPFVDMHDIGDMLVQAGFADPVMDQELITLTWPDADALLAELRSLGGNADPRRFVGLRTSRWRQQLSDALLDLRDGQGRLRLVFEVVYGHAFKVAPKPRMASRTTVALDDMRAMVRSGRRDAGPAGERGRLR